VATAGGTAAMGPSVSGCASQESGEVANSMPKSVVTPMVGFAGGGPASAPVAVAGGRSALADRCHHQTWRPYRNPSFSQIGCRHFPADARGLLNAPQTIPAAPAR
jgi:hypothetical protein